MADPDILDQIDDVIHWDGRSPDAMKWTAEPPKRRYSGLKPIQERYEAAERMFASPDWARFAAALQPDRNAMREAGEQLTRQVQAFVDATRPVFEQMMQGVAEAVRAVAGLAPLLQQVEEAGRAERRAMKSEYARRRRTRGRRR